MCCSFKFKHKNNVLYASFIELFYIPYKVKYIFILITQIILYLNNDTLLLYVS